MRLTPAAASAATPSAITRSIGTVQHAAPGRPPDRGTLPDRGRLPDQGARDRPRVRGSRLAWLDALRGIAALCVVYAHFGARLFVPIHAAVYRVFDPGLYGVLVFFLISGYIVPASLERKGSVRAFWIGRLFRLFPLFGFVIGVTLLLHVFGLASLQGTTQDPPGEVLSHLLMLNDLLGQHNLLVVIWTLSYEMVFYLLLTALYTARQHQRSGTFAVMFGTGALLLGGTLPSVWLSHHLAPALVALSSDVLVLAGLGAAMSGHRRAGAVGAWLAAGTGLTLLLLNERRFAYEGLAILALMFTGTLIYRAQRGQVGRGRAVALAVGVVAAVIAAGAWHIPGVSPAADLGRVQVQWITSVALAGLTFAIGLALRNARVPGALAWLGLVSYSVYLLLPVLLNVYDSLPLGPAFRHDAWVEAGTSVAVLGALLGCAALTYSLVEAPMQRLGRRVAARLDRPPHGSPRAVGRERVEDRALVSADA
jgi:peptidoglycan/LPS O-acetylase OafA/YrhL